jgi:hypothetical protein
MTERQAFIALFIGVLVITFALAGGLLALGADSETVAAANVVIFCIGGFGTGGIIMRYR